MFGVMNGYALQEIGRNDLSQSHRRFEVGLSLLTTKLPVHSLWHLGWREIAAHPGVLLTLRQGPLHENLEAKPECRAISHEL